MELFDNIIITKVREFKVNNSSLRSREETRSLALELPTEPGLGDRPAGREPVGSFVGPRT